jgi:DNA polymerase-3 subunit beta
MKFQIPRDVILKSLQQLSGVVERRQTLPVLGNILVKAADNTLTLAATDLEVELIIQLACVVDDPGEITIPARKWLDICKNLPEDATITISTSGDKVMLHAGRSRFTLSTLPATEFPLIDEISSLTKFSTSQSALKNIFDSTHFSMAQQDVRYYLNGLMMEMSSKLLRSVATDGHRLALKDVPLEIEVNEDKRQIIVPRKGIQELMRLLADSDDGVNVVVGSSHIRITIGDMIFTSKLIDGKFPDYERVMPEGGKNIVSAEKENLRQTLVRVAILSNEKYRGIRIILGRDKMQVMAHNPEQEEAEDEISVEYNGDEFEIGFNANYLLDAINAVQSDQVNIVLTDSNSSCVIKDATDDTSSYVVMPMRL